MRLVILAILPILLAHPGYADQLKKVIDEETGLEVVYVTSEPCTNSAAYPTCKTWSRDGKYIFLESNRKRPDGTKQPIERQLLKVDIETGKPKSILRLFTATGRT